MANPGDIRLPREHNAPMGTGERFCWNVGLMLGLALLVAVPHIGLGALGFALMVASLAGYIWRGGYWRIHRDEVTRRRALRGWRALVKYSPDWVEQATAAMAERQAREIPPTAPTPPPASASNWSGSSSRAIAEPAEPLATSSDAAHTSSPSRARWRWRRL